MEILKTAKLAQLLEIYLEHGDLDGAVQIAGGYAIGEENSRLIVATEHFPLKIT